LGDLALAKRDSRDITTFTEYAAFCGVRSDNAEKYANEGKKLLDYINSDVKAHPKSNQELKDQAAYLQWYLIKTSFDNGIHFGKGMFTIEMENAHKTERLYEYFRNDRKSLYSESTITDNRKRTTQSLQKTVKGVANPDPKNHTNK
jgi:hypothetical protein